MAQITIECKAKMTVWFYIIRMLLRLKIYPSDFLLNRPIARMYINGELTHTFLAKRILDD